MAQSAVPDRFGLAGALVGNRYRVERQVAEGGFAVVYRAFQVALDRPVALKMLKAPNDEAARSRFAAQFANEARTIAKLRHPYIVDVYDYGVSRLPSGDAAPWMALEWLEGETLADELDRRRGAGGRTPAEALPLIRPVVEAVAWAHARGVIHRDIKPANVMVMHTERGRLLRMLDFGIAKMVRREHDTLRIGNSAVAGFSPDYAAPEQVTFSRTGPWTDVHALGLLLTELLTDEPPFAEQEGSDEALFEQVMAPARPTPRRKGKHVGAALEAVIAKAVALSPGERWRDAGALLEALDGIDTATAGRRPGRHTETAVVSRTPPRAETARRASVRPEPRAVVAAGALLVAAALGALVATFESSASAPSATDEMSASARSDAARALARERVASRAMRPPQPAAPAPWIVPLPAAPPAPVAAATATQPPIAVEKVEKPRRAASTRVASAAAPTTTPSPVAAETCALMINSVPWSMVWLDGENTGHQTPFVSDDVACGRHRVEFRRPDLHIKESASIAIKPGETFKHRYLLTTGVE